MQKHVHEKGSDLPEGVYDVDYYIGRQTKRQLVYRLRRRTDEVEAALRKYGEGHLETIIDVGTADGLMVEELRRRLGDLRFVGLDRSLPLLNARHDGAFLKIYGDAQILPFASGVADAIVATAIIEHLPEPEDMIRECARVLRPGGLIVETTPEPTMEHLASLLGVLKESGHQHTFNIKQLRQMFSANGFEIVDSHKFMFSPIGFPGEKLIERLFGPLGLRLVMANQLLVGRRRQHVQA